MSELRDVPLPLGHIMTTTWAVGYYRAQCADCRLTVTAEGVNQHHLNGVIEAARERHETDTTEVP